ncbi:MAG: hypothetical protein J1E97_02510 [Muribaculaceae bacterium]|nr:hypothetical protein [Muribaculaceae bacterium]
MIELKDLSHDTDGMATYDYIVNHVPDCVVEMDYLTENLLRTDTNGQFLASSARFLNSIDAETFRPWIYRLIEGAIERDRERRYIGTLLESIWGTGYMERAETLKKEDDNFRRIFKRIYQHQPNH